MGMFLEVRIDAGVCQSADGCDLCVRLCPVEVFQVKDGVIHTDENNEDECTLCNLCVDQCPVGAVQVIKRY